MSEKRRRKLIEKNAEQIGRYLAYRELFEKQTAGSSFSEESDRVSENATTISEKGWRLIDDVHNQDAHKYLSAILPEMRRLHWVDYRPFQRIESDPGILTQWKKEETEEDREWLRAYMYACRLAAKMLLTFYGPVEIKVRLAPRDEPVSSLREASNQDRRRGLEDSYRIIASKVEQTIEELKAEQGHDRGVIEAAKGLVADRMDISYARVHRARLFKLAEDREEAG